MQAGSKKDFFISYNRHDESWAEWIAWTLEAAGYEVVIEKWDFRPGGNFALEMQQATTLAERTIMVLSKNYLNGKFTHPEWAAAFAQDPTGEKRLLLPIRVGACDPPGMLKTFIYVDLVGVGEATAQDLVLRAVQQGRTKPEQKPPFPVQAEATPTGAKPLYPRNLIQNLPYGTPNFVGRSAELEQIHKQLQQRSQVAISAISGMGGIGKTELALQYARIHCREETYPGGICWLRAREEMGTQIITFARSQFDLTPPEDLELVEKVRWCWRRWREGAALLILDDVQKYEDVELFLPPQDSRFCVLMTTRSHFGFPVEELQLDVLSEERALELLRSLVENDRPDLRSLENSDDLKTAKQICQWLGYLPLGIELVGRYLAKKPDLTLEILWQRLQDKRLEARAFKQAEPGMTASLGVTAAFELSWQALDESAQRVAAVLSLFAPVEISWRMVEQCLPEMDAEELEEIRDQQLLGTHLLKRVEQGMYQLHQLLREFFAAKRSQRMDATALEDKFCKVIIAEAERVTEKPERPLLKETEFVVPHLQAMIEMRENARQELDLALGLQWLALLYDWQGRYDEAEPLLLRSLALREQQLGIDHPDVAQSLSLLAYLHHSQGRYSLAEGFLERSLLIREQQLGADHSDVAQSLNDLATIYRSQGRYNEAEPLHLRSLAIREQQLGKSHLDTAQSLNHLAELYRLQERYAEAELLYQRSLAIREQRSGTMNPAVGSTLNNLAKLYTYQGRYSEAEPLYSRALFIHEQHLGKKHPFVATILTNLASLYELQGRYAEAEPLYRQALAILSMKLESNHPCTVAVRENFLRLLKKVIQDDRTDELSNAPMTQVILKELKGDGSG